MLVKRNNRHCLMNAVCIIFMILSFVLAGCSAPEKMTVEKLKEVAPVSSYEKVSEMKTIQLPKIITGEDIYMRLPLRMLCVISLARIQAF